MENSTAVAGATLAPQPAQARSAKPAAPRLVGGRRQPQEARDQDGLSFSKESALLFRDYANIHDP